MAQSNENADLSKNNNSGGSGNNNGNSNAVVQKDNVIDIKKFLQKNKAKYGKSISGLLEVLFKDQTAKESEWTKKVSDAINRQVK
jgi:hypothetical protein